MNEEMNGKMFTILQEDDSAGPYEQLNGFDKKLTVLDQKPISGSPVNPTEEDVAEMDASFNVSG